MKGYIQNIEKLTLENDLFRKVVYTTHNSQLVLMAIKVGGEIGEEVHGVDQFLRVEGGSGKAILNGVETAVSDGSAIVVPAGTRHNFVNTGSEPLKLYTLYSPPHHKDGVIHKTKEEADADTSDEFDGKTSQ